jgi:hypothetical protein
MVRIEVGFEPHPFEKAMIEQTKEDIENRLQGHEFGRFKIVLKNRRKASKSPSNSSATPKAATKRNACSASTDRLAAGPRVYRFSPPRS